MQTSYNVATFCNIKVQVRALRNPRGPDRNFVRETHAPNFLFEEVQVGDSCEYPSRRLSPAIYLARANSPKYSVIANMAAGFGGHSDEAQVHTPSTDVSLALERKSFL